jgi:hypothetical protein
MKKDRSTECTTRICRLNDCTFLRSVKVRREVSGFLERKLGIPVKLENLPTAAEIFLAQKAAESLYGSIEFGLVLKLLFVCGGRVHFGGNCDYRQCPLIGGADFQMDGIELITTNFDQILARLRALIEMERSTDCTAVMKDHFCKPLYQLAHLREIELKRSDDVEPTFDSVREKLRTVCYEMTLILDSAGEDRNGFPLAQAKREAC